jgi:hypothetical protein
MLLTFLDSVCPLGYDFVFVLFLSFAGASSWSDFLFPAQLPPDRLQKQGAALFRFTYWKLPDSVSTRTSQCNVRQKLPWMLFVRSIDLQALRSLLRLDMRESSRKVSDTIR